MKILKNNYFIISTAIFLLYELFSLFILQSLKNFKVSLPGRTQIESSDIINIIGVDINIKKLAYTMVVVCILFIIANWIFSLAELKRSYYASSIVSVIYILIIFASTTAVMSEGFAGYSGFLMMPVMFFVLVLSAIWLVMFFKSKNKKSQD